MASSFICRVCESTKTLSDIFAKDGRNILRKMRLFLNPQIEANDLLPQCICIECTAKLNDAYNFKTQYEKTNRKYVKAASLIFQTDKYELSDKIAEKSDLSLNYDMVKEEFEIAKNQLASGSKSFKADIVYDSEILIKEELSLTYLDDGADGEEDEIVSVIMHDEENEKINSSTMEDALVKGSECSTIENGESSKRKKATGDKNNLSIPRKHEKQLTNLFKQHKKFHSDPDVFKCKECGKGYSHRTSLTHHKESHLNLKCSKCGKSFTRKYNLARHELAHENPDRLRCKRCGKQFTTIQYLKEHKFVHKSFKCTECGKCYLTSRQLHLHEQIHLNNFKCSKCGKKFSHWNNLMQHDMFHAKPELFQCKKCGKHFSTIRYLKRHEIMHSKHDISVYNTTYSSCKLLKLHDVRDFKDFKCSKCGRHFKTEYGWTKHKLFHEMPDALGCKKCGRRFISMHYLKRHEVYHSDHDVLKCDK